MKGFSFVKVVDDKQRKAWGALISKSYKAEIEKSDTEDQNYNLFLLLKDNEAIAVSATHRFEEEDRGLYFMSVLPEQENSALFKILAMETINYEKNHGCEFMVTQAEEKWVDIFKELGFIKSHSI